MDTLANGVASVYLRAESQRNSPRPGSQQSDEVSSRSKPALKVNVSPLGHVTLFVLEEPSAAKMKDLFYSITKVDIPKFSDPKIKRYLKPVNYTHKVGPGAPIIWPSSKDLPESVRDAIEGSLDELIGQLNPSQAKNLTKALVKVGIDSPQVSQVKAPGISATL